jgi:hypothetical protein
MSTGRRRKYPLALAYMGVSSIAWIIPGNTTSLAAGARRGVTTLIEGTLAGATFMEC